MTRFLNESVKLTAKLNTGLPLMLGSGLKLRSLCCQPAHEAAQRTIPARWALANYWCIKSYAATGSPKGNCDKEKLLKSARSLACWTSMPTNAPLASKSRTTPSVTSSDSTDTRSAKWMYSESVALSYEIFMARTCCLETHCALLARPLGSLRAGSGSIHLSKPSGECGHHFVLRVAVALKSPAQASAPGCKAF